MDSKRSTNNLLHKLGVLALLGVVIFLTGCKTRNVLFNTPRKYERMKLAVVHLNADSTARDETYQHRIKPDDRIAVRFLNNFDISERITMNQQGSGNTGISFLVDRNGSVSLPMLGKVKVEGMTKIEAQELLVKEYSRHFKNPSVEVAILNLSVSVQGEVGQPGIYTLAREKTTLLEVLSAAGGITQFGKQRLVKVFRGVAQGKEPEIFIFDLRQLDAIETTELILRDKDVVYVEPRDIRVVANAVAPYSTFVTLLSTVATLTVIVINLSNLTGG